MDYFDKLAKNIKTSWRNLIKKVKTYLKRLIYPLYFFPIKLLIYPIYYLIKFIVKLLLAFIGLIFDIVIFPFKSLKNFLKAIVISIIGLYLVASLFVISDYLTKQ